MTMASGLYVATWRDATDTSNSVLNLLLNTNKVDLYLDAKTPNFDTDAAYSATNEVATATGYTRDTMTVGGTPTYDSSSDGVLKYSWSAPVEWTAATITARGFIVHTAADNLPIVAVTFGSDFASTNGSFKITAHADGIFSMNLVP